MTQSTGATEEYREFLEAKGRNATAQGVEAENLNAALFDFQSHLVSWALERGRSAIMADCGLGKTPMLLAWGEAVNRATNKPVLVLAPLAVSMQTVREGEKFGIEVRRSDDGTLHPGITVTNYERLHYFSPDELGGVIGDESSILKAFDGVTKAAVTEFMRRVPYRLLCTATAAPNDYIELGTHSEALGELGYIDMLNRFFVNDQRNSAQGSSYRRGGHDGGWRFKGHAEQPFWRWVCSWGRAMRRPSDLGFGDGRFVLPPLTVQEHVIEARTIAPGRLFDVAAVGLQEEREVRRRTIQERCEMAAALTNGRDASVVWVHLNDEQSALERMLGDRAISVHGQMPTEAKEEQLRAWLNRERPVLISKPTVCGFGLNMQHCAHVVYFPSDSYELYYQAVRRCWRFGQDRPVTVDIVRTESQERTMGNLQRKSEAADRMFSDLVTHMQDAMTISKPRQHNGRVEVPQWLLAS